jgi:D-alanyl-D-alanine carboxypeptidase-like protein
MPTTDNHYSAPPKEGIRPCGWDGAFAVPGVKDWDPVWDVFQYLMREFDTRVEWLREGWCWGYSYRPNANNPNMLSRHSGGIAVDLNAPLHPNGVPTNNTFTSGQRATVNVILDEIKCPCHDTRVLRWGGDYNGTPDAMHFEINVPSSCVTNAAQQLKDKEDDMNDQDLAQIKQLFREQLQPVKEASVKQTQRIVKMEKAAAQADLRQTKMLKALVADMNEENRADFEDAVDELEASANERLAAIEDMETEPSES